MKRFLALIICVALLCPIVACAAEDGGNNEIYVMYTDGSDAVLSCSSSAEAERRLSELSEDEDVVLAAPNYRYTADALSTTDEYASRQWALSNDGSFYMEDSKNEHPVFDTPFGDVRMPGQWREPDRFGRPGGRMRGYAASNVGEAVRSVPGIDINAADAWTQYKDSGKEITVAIVDTGIDASHPELRGRLWQNAGEIAANGIDDDGNGYVDDVNGWNFYNNSNNVFIGSEDDHGTHGAGTIAAIADNGIGISGIANSGNIKVMSVKALGGSDGSGTTASIIRAIQYAEKNGAVICNLSLGTTNNDKALYQTIANSNMLFVVAAGNDGRNTDYAPSYPASYALENIISVANLNYDGNLHYSSNYGERSVDIAAPGSYILSTTSGGGYSYMTGTSMSAPMVSAAAALVYSHFGDAVTLSGVKEIILSSATKLESLSGEVSSGGMLNLAAALSFDLNGLRGLEWERKTPVEYKGKAPEISISLVTSGNSQYLNISLYDEDGDASGLEYASGERNEQYFKDGNGTRLEIGGNKAATIKPEVGTFTFFATDAMGNATVRVVNITEGQNRARGGRMPGYMRDPFVGYMPEMPELPQMREIEEMEELFREITAELFPELESWFFGR